jgi:hypothetical protein
MNTKIKQLLINDEVKYIMNTLNACEKKGHYYYVHKEISPDVLKILKANSLFVHCEKDLYTYICRNAKKSLAVKQMNPSPPKIVKKKTRK